MPKFFIGQRARIRYIVHTAHKHLEGKEVRITHMDEALDLSRFPDGKQYGTDIFPIRIVDGKKIGLASDQLEPIIPEGAAPSEYSFSELLDKIKTGQLEAVK